LVADFDGDVGISGAAGTFAWLDQSGNAYNGAALGGSSVLSSAPDALFNDHTVVTFDGVTDGVVADAVAAAFSGSGKPAYLVSVVQLVTSAALASQWSFGDTVSIRPLFAAQNNGVSNWRIQRRNDANVLTTSTGGGAPDTAVPHILEVLWDPNTNEVSLWIDGVVKINAAAVLAVDPVTFTTFTLGLERLFGSNTQFANIKLARQLVYKRIPTTLERTALRQYLQYLYGTP
jgi:hypothetical protein